VALRQGELEEALQHARASLRIAGAHGSDDRYAAVCIEVLAWIAALRQQYAAAATLLGAAERLLRDRGSPVASYQMLVADHEACERRLRQALGDAAFENALRHGCRLSFSEALAYALADRPRSVPAPSTRDSRSTLTRRERQIADLIGEGLSNKEIAAALVISQRTAESHVEHVLAKLGFTNRAQVAAWITAQPAAGPHQ
jgi:DNA-binding NarL/FixJ family response regulator